MASKVQTSGGVGVLAMGESMRRRSEGLAEDLPLRDQIGERASDTAIGVDAFEVARPETGGTRHQVHRPRQARPGRRPRQHGSMEHKARTSPLPICRSLTLDN